MSKRQRKARLPDQPVRVSIESLAHDGRGVARVEGKTVFVDGALPGEEVSFLYTRRARKHDEGRVCELHSLSAHRVEPRCAAFAICGGCSLQHLAPEQQILAKQQTLLDNLQRIGKVQPERVLDALTGPVWGYRNKARLGVKYVRKKGRVLVGFREKRAPYLADIARCEVLHAAVGPRLGELAELIQGMEARERIAQIEVAVGDDIAVLVFRNLDPLSAADTQTLVDYAKHTGLHIYLQPAGPDSIELLWPGRSELCYRLPDYDLTLHFLPTDFTQVNPAINPPMIRQALQLLELDPRHRVLDLFCGLGNFTLPMARRVAHVVGVEGEAGLVQRARDNAAANGINNVDYHVVDLSWRGPATALDAAALRPHPAGPAAQRRAGYSAAYRETGCGAHCLRGVPSRFAGARCGYTGARAGLSPGSSRGDGHVSAHRARGIHGSFREAGWLKQRRWRAPRIPRPPLLTATAGVGCWISSGNTAASWCPRT